MRAVRGVPQQQSDERYIKTDERALEAMNLVAIGMNEVLVCVAV